jgi:hypothetical protein
VRYQAIIEFEADNDEDAKTQISDAGEALPNAVSITVKNERGEAV